MDARSKYLARKNTPTPFSQGPEMQNYTQMMNLQNQASSFAPNDPRIQELKDRRRQYNRQDKYKIGEKFNVSPLDVQRDFANRSETLRLANPAAYKQMYPITSAAMDYIGSGGLMGMMAKKMFNKVRDTGSDMVQKKGIFGAVDADEEEMQDYAAQTFGMGAPIDRHPGTKVEGIEYNLSGPADTSTSEVIYSPHGPTYYDRAEVLDFDEDPNQPYVAPDNYVEDDFGAFYTDENTLAPERPMPFDDSNREAGIMSQYPTNFIGPRDNPNRRPTMADVAGPLYPGLIPFPEYGPQIVYTEGRGRGDLPRYGYDYAAERKGREDSLKLQQLLDYINSQKIEPEPSRMNLR